MTENKKPFHILDRIKELREAKGWSAARLARETGIPQQTMQSWYSRDNYPSIDKLEAICGVLGITLAQFFSPPGSFTAEGADAGMLEKLHLLDEEQRKLIEGMTDEFLRANREKQNAG